MTQYEILEEYVHAQRQDIDQGNPVTVEVRDVDTFERLIVKARLGPPEAPIENGEQLILKNLAENVVTDQWTIEVLEELDDDTEISPQSDFRKNAPDAI